MPRDWRSIFDPSEPYYSTESYARWAFGDRPVEFTDYDPGILAACGITLEVTCGNP